MSDATQYLLLFGAILFTLGLVGFLTRRSIILMFLSLEMMLAGVSVNLIAFSKQHQNYQGQVMSIMVITVAACEAAIALALVVSLYRRKPSLDIQLWSDLNETPKLPVVEKPMNRIEEEAMEYPKLVPSGLDPLVHPMPVDIDDLTSTNKPENRERSGVDMEVAQHA